MFTLLLLIISSVSSSSNILVTVPFSGSHFLAIKTLAELLSIQGHNITILALEKDNRFKIMPNITVIHPDNWDAERTNKLISRTAENIVRNVRSSDMVLEALGSENWREILMMVRDYYTGDEVQDILEKGNFSMIISDIRSVTAISIAAWNWNIPIVNFCPAISYFPARLKQNLPMLLTSEPGFNMNIKRNHSPTFWERWTTIWDFTKASMTFWVQEKLWDESLIKFGINSLSDVDDQVKLYLVNDNIAFSFPFLAPPNLVTIGGYNFRSPHPLPSDFVTFLDNSGNEPVIFLSLGSYATLKMIPWLNIIISSLNKINARVILKSSSSDEFIELSQNFFVRSWVPQVDLLGSGKVSIFISHCGNNGRLESIYYQVPLLCIPLWGDQLLNANLVLYNGFGEMILKEEVEETKVVMVLKKLIDNHAYYKDKTSRALDIFNRAPVSSKDKLMYFIELLIEHGNLDFLQNKILKHQDLVEMYNLDIALVLAVGGIFIIVLAIYLLRKCLHRKVKTE